MSRADQSLSPTTPMRGVASPKSGASEAATADWILMLDADEVPAGELGDDQLAPLRGERHPGRVLKRGLRVERLGSGAPEQVIEQLRDHTVLVDRDRHEPDPGRAGAARSVEWDACPNAECRS